MGKLTTDQEVGSSTLSGCTTATTGYGNSEKLKKWIWASFGQEKADNL